MNRNILKALETNQLVIVVGNDLSVVKLPKSSLEAFTAFDSIKDSVMEDGEHFKLNINDYLALELSVNLDSDKPLPQPFNLNSVVVKLMRSNKRTEDDIKGDILIAVKDLTDDQIELEPFRKLVKLGYYDSILTVNFDNFLERAFEAEGKKINPSINFSIQDSNRSDGTIDTDRAIPTTYNLMGNIMDSDFALTEEMQLEYLYSLLTGKDAKTKALFDAVKDKSILLVGCSFPNWFMRFFIRVIAKNRYKRGKSKFVASDRTAQDFDLSTFLENNNTRVIPIGTPVKEFKNGEEIYENTIEFIDELFGKAESHKNIETEIKPKYIEKIFLSYSWGDKSLIKKLKNEFEKSGVELFFDDDDLRNGDNFAESISDYINKCDYILPLISDNALSRTDSYVYGKEWTQAIHVERFKKSSGLFKNGQESYIRPYIIDDTLPTDDRIPEEIRQTNITAIPTADDYPAMVKKFIKENKLTKIDS